MAYDLSKVNSVAEPAEISGADRRAAMASVIGTTIEWYDFFIYGTAAALVFPTLFFGSTDDRSLMASFSTIFVGFISRPLGAMLFGHMGDRVGRKSTLVATLLLMGLSTVAIGVLPTKAEIGSLGGWLLVLFRFLQGVGVGGEWGGAVLLSMETHVGRRRGLMASLPHIGVPLGLVFSVLVWGCCSYLFGPDLSAWAWRIPFVGSAAFLVIGLVIRARIPETTDFLDAKRRGMQKGSPLIIAVRDHWRSILLAALIRPGEQASFYMLSTFVVLYGSTELGMGKAFILNAVLVAAVISCFAVPLFGHLADRFGRRRVYMTGAILMTLFAFPYFAMLQTAIPVIVVLAIVLLMIFHDMMYGSQAAYISEAFPPEIRYSAASLGYQGASIIAGGPAPMISLWLYTTFHSGYAVAGYLAAMGFISVVGSLLLKDHSAHQA